MIVHRLAKAVHTALDGEGARLWGGRWNSPGRAMIYAAASPSLALLEVLVHLDLTLDLLPDDYRMLAIELPGGAPTETMKATPGEAAACRDLGDDFLRRGSALALLAPSMIVPQEQNALINPSHPAAARLKLVGNDAFPFDQRLARA